MTGAASAEGRTSSVRAEIRFLAKHSAVYGLGNLLSRAVSFVLLPLYTRYLSPADYGVLELIDVTSNLISIVVGLGIAAALTRFYYDLEDAGRKQLVGTVYVLAFGLSVVSAGPIMWAAPWLAKLVFGSQVYTPFLRVAFASLLLSVVVDIGSVYLRIIYRSTLFIGVSIAYLLVGVSLNVLFVVYFSLGPLGVLSAGLLSRCLVGIPITLLILRHVGVSFSMAQARQLCAFSLPLVPSSLGTTVVNYSNRYFLAYFSSVADAGLLGLASKVSSSVHMFVTVPFTMVFLPRRFEIAQLADAPATLARIFDAYFAGVLALCTILAVFIPEIMVLMTTPPFYPAGHVVPILLAELLAIGSKYHFEFGVLYAKRTTYYFYVNLVTALGHVVVSFFLIRELGIYGAALGGLLSSSLQAVLLHLASSRLYPIPFAFARQGRRILLAAGVVLLSRAFGGAGLLVDIGMKGLLVVAFLGALAAQYGVHPRDLPRLRRQLAVALRKSG